MFGHCRVSPRQLIEHQIDSVLFNAGVTSVPVRCSRQSLLGVLYCCLNTDLRYPVSFHCIFVAFLWLFLASSVLLIFVLRALMLARTLLFQGRV